MPRTDLLVEEGERQIFMKYSVCTGSTCKSKEFFVFAETGWGRDLYKSGMYI